MATNEETLKKVEEYLTEAYTHLDTSLIPKKEDLTFGNTVKEISHVKVFYIDMRKSRKILSDASTFWSVKIHKAFLGAVTHCIEKYDGHLRSFNGDGLLAFFIDDKAASRAVRTALTIKGFVREINKILENNKINPIDFGIGIAQGKVMVAKSGKAGDDKTKQDLIWVGLPLYVAVELSEIGNSPNNIWISHNIRSAIEEEKYLDVVYDNNTGESIWVKHEKELKSVGKYDVRTTNYYCPI
jgi:class 3 adenylate cyclase